MYLAPVDVAATLAVIANRSAAKSRLVILYARRTVLMTIAGLVVRLLGEPFRSAYEPAAMRELLAQHGFAVVRDEGLPEVAAALSPELGRANRPMKHLRLVTADQH